MKIWHMIVFYVAAVSLLMFLGYNLDTDDDTIGIVVAFVNFFMVGFGISGVRDLIEGALERHRDRVFQREHDGKMIKLGGHRYATVEEALEAVEKYGWNR